MRLRVLVVDDSLTVRKRLCEVLSASPEVQVVGEAGDGKRAIELCQQLRPDVVTMDMMLPIMTGLAATEYIMAYCPTPILVVSSSFNRGELFKTFEALSAGAVDVLEKPRDDEAEGSWERRFIAAVKMVARVRVITHPRARLAVPEASARVRKSGRRADLIALGASTGGPGAIVDVLRDLPLACTVPILIVLHINEPFGKAFADWLDGQSQRRVRYAVHGERLAACQELVLLAPPGYHMVAESGILCLNTAPERHSCRPCVDCLFETVAREYGSGVVAALLTGMGRDGAAGLLAVRRAGGFTVAQDEATSVVYGMPREAMLLGAAERILPLPEIGATLSRAAMEASS